ncbi:MAG: DUF393 domain-containing protein [Phycisphaerales bacterium]|nr:DUF393 domain-containing protein [Phycisphaerales bacterium]MCB9856297.1 DUF393 domain-containing protein [Phycisphaerales bacterium]MCB9863264.1 DUF393 domain-containing protein [Phycisphaerales bacterium]
MCTEITDKTGLEAAGRSIIVWDDACSACNAMKQRVASYATARGYVFCPMRVWLDAHPEASAAGMYVVTPAGRRLFGVDAALHVATLVWWLRPLNWLSRLPLMHSFMAAGYRWFAAHRHAFGCKACEGGRSSCRLNETHTDRAD